MFPGRPYAKRKQLRMVAVPQPPILGEGVADWLQICTA
jgi:hypothetical protein